jgi:hypothetical protein
MGQITTDYLKKGRVFVSGEKKYVDKCVKLLDDWIWCSYVGKAILEEIFAGSNKLDFNIVPSGFLADLEPTTNLKTVNDGYASGYKDPNAGVTGTGTGTGVSISLTDTLGVSDKACNTILHVPCSSVAYMRTEFVLMHEIVHANRALRGKMRTVSQGNHMKNSEEAIAILITNMLMSEKGAAALRKNYDTADALDSDPALFVKAAGNESLVRQVATDHPTLKTKVNTSTAPIRFNPIYSVFQGSA